jgi:hypothetical protein
MGPGIATRRPALIAAALALLTAFSLALRTSGLRSGYWIDEGIAVGIASHPLADIPRALVQDGSPPPHLLLPSGWRSPAAASPRARFAAVALIAVPVSFWAGSAAFDRRTGARHRGSRVLPVPDLLRAGDADVLARGRALWPRPRPSCWRSRGGEASRC